MGRIEVLKELARCSSHYDRRNDVLCWNMYNNMFEEADYDYLTKVNGQYVLPARMRHIPKQRPYIDFLTSRQIERPFQFSIVCTDKKSLKRKLENKAKFFLEQYKLEYNKAYDQIDASLQEIESQKQEISDSMQKEPQNEQEAMQQQQLKKSMPQIEAKIKGVQKALQDQQIFTMQNIKKYERLQKYTNRDFVEQIAQKAMMAYRQKLNIHQKSVSNLISQTVTGKQYYLVDYRPGDPLPIYRALQQNNVFYQASDDVDWVQDLDWCGFDERMGISDVISEFTGNDIPEANLTEAQRQSIENRYYGSAGGTDAGPFVATEDGKAVDAGAAATYISGGAVNPSQGTRVIRIWWQAERRITVIRRINKYRPGSFFTTFINGEEKKPVIDEKNYYYRTEKDASNRNIGKWILKMDQDKELQKVYDDKAVRTIDTRRGDYVTQRVVYDRYKGAIIGSDIFIAYKDPIQPISVDNYSKKTLPIVGMTFSNITNQPYSYIWATKDIQKQINITHYHQELMMAIAGTKSVLYDEAQRPEGMTDDEFEYQKKLGNIKIQTRKKGAPSIPSTFNQWTVLDLSLSSSIQYLQKIIDNLDNQMGLIMGVTRQAMGQVVNNDQVGTFQMSQQSTLLITEALYAKHDEIERRALSLLLNIAKQYLWDKDTMLQYINEDGEDDVLEIPGGVLNLSDYDVMMITSTKDERAVSELKNYSLQNYAKGLLPFQNFVQMYSVESLMELKKMAEYFAEESQRLQSESRNADADQQLRIEKEKAQIQAQMQQLVKKQENEIKQMQVQVDKSRVELEKYISDQNVKIQTEAIQSKEKMAEEKIQADSQKSQQTNQITDDRNKAEIDVKMIMAKLKEMEILLKGRNEKVSN